MFGALTQDIKGRQDIKLHATVQQGGPEHEAQCAGIVPCSIPNLKLHCKRIGFLTGFQLPPDFPDEFSSAIKLLLKTSEVAEEDHEVGIGSASEGRAFARGAALKQRRMSASVRGEEPPETQR